MTSSNESVNLQLTEIQLFDHSLRISVSDASLVFVLLPAHRHHNPCHKASGLCIHADTKDSLQVREYCVDSDRPNPHPPNRPVHPDHSDLVPFAHRLPLSVS